MSSALESATESGLWLRALAVFVGSGAGGVLRWALALASHRLAWGWATPWPALGATWAANVVGSLALAVLVSWTNHRGAWASEPVRLALTTGVMGGFTTYSTFNTEMIALISQARVAEAVGYGLLTLGSCLLGGWIGWSLVA